MEKIEEYQNFAIELAKVSGTMIIRGLESEFEVENKTNRYDCVTEHDRSIEKYIFDSIRQRYPTHILIGEESSSSEKTTEEILSDEPTWIVDPIDGTMNFVHRNPLCCVSIGLAINKELVLGVINIPKLCKLYSAIKGRGAFCNGSKISVSPKRPLKDALLMSEMIFKRGKSDRMAKVADELIWQSHGVRMIGSTCVGLCLVADGSGDAYFHRGIHVWDIAAGSVIVVEAGGCVRSYDGSKFHDQAMGILATSNDELADVVGKTLSQL